MRGTALRANPDVVKLQILQTWNGHSPLVVGAGGAGVMLSLEELARRDAAATPPAAPSAAPRPNNPAATAPKFR